MPHLVETEPPPTNNRRRRFDVRALVAVPVLVLSLAIVLVAAASIGSRQPSLRVDGVAEAGETIVVHGTGFESTARLGFTWDAAAIGGTGVVVRPDGSFSIALRVPEGTTPGPHVVAAVASPTDAPSQASTPLATAAVDVVDATAELPSSPSPDPGPASPSATPELTVPLSSPASRQSPSPAADESPRPTPAPSVATATPAPSAPPPPVTVVADALYVSPSGSDSNPGTADQPLRSVGHALATVAPGQTLYLRGGTYVEDIGVEMSQGRADAPVLVSAYPGERPVIQGLVSIQNPRFVTFNGFNVTWNAGEYDQHMFKISGGTNWVLQNSEIWGARSFANLLISGAPQGWAVRGNAIHDTYGGEEDIFRSHNIYANTDLAATAGVIERNLIYNAEHGSNLKLAARGDGSGGAANVVVRYNTLHNATHPLLIGDGSTNITVERNIIGGGRRGYLLRLFALTGSGVVVRDNLGFGADAFCMDYDSPTPCSSVVSGSTFPVDPVFAPGLVPTNPAAQTFGRYAP